MSSQSKSTETFTREQVIELLTIFGSCLMDKTRESVEFIKNINPDRWKAGKVVTEEWLDEELKIYPLKS